MKPKILITTMLLLIAIFQLSAQMAKAETTTNNSFTFSCTDQFQSVSKLWQSNLEQVFPETAFNIISNEPEVLTASINQENSLTLLAESELTGQDNTIWKMVIGRQILVPIMAETQLLNSELKSKGTTIQTLRELAMGANKSTHIYYMAGEPTRALLSDFLGNEDGLVQISPIDNIETLKTKLEQDKSAIGFVLLSDLIGNQEGEWLSGIKPLPIDFNADGNIGKVENIYNSPAELNRAAWIGKYPKELIQSVYLATANRTLSNTQMEFVQWVITKGQIETSVAGIYALNQAEVPAKISKLEPAVVLTETPLKTATIKPYVIVLLVIIIFGVVVFELMSKRTRKDKGTLLLGLNQSHKIFNTDSIETPMGLYYDRSHTWAFQEKDGSIRVGLDDFLQKLTGPLSRVMLLDEGSSIAKGEALFTLIQDGKQIKVMAPVSGTIKAINTNASMDAKLINSSPYNDGWLYLIEPDNWKREAVFLRTADSYKEWLKKEFQRFKDFLSNVATTTDNNKQVVLQDGGELLQNTLQNLGPEVWEDFQNKFLDLSN